MDKKWVAVLKDSMITVLLLAGATAVGWLCKSLALYDSTIVIIYLLAILLTARLTRGFWYGLIGSMGCFLLFNWFFTEPYFSFKIKDPNNIITVVIMSVTAFITSALTSKVMKSAAEAREKEAEANALCQLTNHLSDAETCDAIVETAIKSVGHTFNCCAACVCFDEAGEPFPTFAQQRSDGTLIHREVTDPQQLKQRMENLHAAADCSGEFCDYPIYGQAHILAVLRLSGETGQSLTEAQTRLLHSIIESTALAMERLRSLQAQAKSREETTQERYRGNLLRAISHDLRTPLSGIMGTSEMLMDMAEPSDPRYELAKGIYKDADWLHGLVENILNLTKFQDGRLQLHKEPEAVEEVVGAALTVMEKRIPGRKIEVSIPENLLLVPMDARLIAQVLVNLLDNAAKHTPDTNEISISVTEQPEARQVTCAVCDRGSGIAPDDLPHVFQMFYTTPGQGADSRPGVGLGLAICQSIVEAHGGSIRAENRRNGGARFIFTIPLEGENHESAQ